MNARSWVALGVAAALAAPAAIALLAPPLQALTGIPVPRLVESAFAALGVTNASPLPVRQAWYFGAYILAPLAGTGIVLSVAILGRPRWALLTAGGAGFAIAAFWTVRSLLDD